MWSVGWCFPWHSTLVEHVRGMFKVRDWRIWFGVWGGVSHVIGHILQRVGSTQEKSAAVHQFFYTDSFMLMGVLSISNSGAT